MTTRIIIEPHQTVLMERTEPGQIDHAQLLKTEESPVTVWIHGNISVKFTEVPDDYVLPEPSEKKPGLTLVPPASMTE